MLAPALHSIAKDLNTSEEETQIFLSIFVLAFAFGPMVLSPLTELFGRRPVWLVASCFYILWNTVAGFSRTSCLVISSRVLSGTGASAGFAVTQPVPSDCWIPAERGKSFPIATFIPLLGPAIGPIIGGAVSQSIGWRWTSWILSIYESILVIVGVLVPRETYEPIILDRMAGKLRKDTGKPYFPVLQVAAIFLAYNFGILYIVLSTFAALWIDRYGNTETQSGLHYIVIVIGYTIAAQGGGYITDCLWQHLKTRHGEDTAPEYRVLLMVPGAILIPLGLFIYGWSAERHFDWIAMQAYVVEAYRKYVASASAAAQFLCSIAGFAFPVFAPAMYRSLGYGWGNSVLALAFVIIGWPAPFLLWKYGAKLRALGKPQW
ncbi:putative Major facilitator superfamily (MFS) profile domain-containing protein [Seiridium unicorne]|uniref:Major facilitator superfamily (MFS) profile domain-containing protein n=1 Tax=Seiridium unicorne TaxID=138068 RepID=A0ABR2VH00_9PEZI